MCRSDALLAPGLPLLADLHIDLGSRISSQPHAMWRRQSRHMQDTPASALHQRALPDCTPPPPCIQHGYTAPLSCEAIMHFCDCCRVDSSLRTARALSSVRCSRGALLRTPLHICASTCHLLCRKSRRPAACPLISPWLRDLMFMCQIQRPRNPSICCIQGCSQCGIQQTQPRRRGDIVVTP